MDEKKKCYEIRKSDVHGTGVFAMREIKKGERVAEYVGEKVFSEDGQRIEDESMKKNGTTYIFELDDKHDLNGDVGYNDARFINHSCDPNCESDIVEGHVWIVAVRDIEPGEEISYSYDFDFDDESEYKKHVCRCGSKKCRGFISKGD